MHLEIVPDLYIDMPASNSNFQIKLHEFSTSCLPFQII